MAIAKHKTRRRELQEGRTLARRVQRGDRRAFELLYASYEGGLFRFCYRLTGSATAAAALVEATFSHALATLPEDGLDTVDVGAHLYATARSLSYRRHDNGNGNGNGNGAAAGEHAGEVVAANARLAPRQRMALALRDLEGRPDDEIALALGAEPPVVPALVARARLRLRAELALPAAIAGCDGYLADLSAYADGTLPAERRPAVEGHLQECAECRRALFALQEAAQRYRAVPVPVPPGELSSRMAAAVGAAGLPERRVAPAAAAAPGEATIAHGGRQTAAAIVMAALVVVGVVVTLVARNGGGSSKGGGAPPAQTAVTTAAHTPLTSPAAAAGTTPAATTPIVPATTPAPAGGGRITPPKQRHARSGTLHFPHESKPVVPARAGTAVERTAFPTTSRSAARTRTPVPPAAASTAPEPLPAPKTERQIPVQILPPTPPPSTPAPANATPSSPSSPDPTQTTTT